MLDTFKNLKSELHAELLNILAYWTNNTLDLDYGGFFGRIDHFGGVIPNANKGVILNTRILWSFSAASNFLQTPAYKGICDRAYQYLNTYFKDIIQKGVYWELDYKGNPKNKRKQVYAQAFTVYALSEYYVFSKNEEAKQWAIEIFEILEKHAKDYENRGYFEAFKNDWSLIEDMRLSSKDMYASKTMNTNLHVLEAYTSLLRIYDNVHLKASLKMLIEVFFENFLNSKNHYDLFFDNKWNLLSNTVSFGHDIETAWLLIEASKTIGDKKLIKLAAKNALKVTDTFLNEGIDVDGAVINEKNLTTNHLDSDRHWWPQVEALVGLKYAYQISKDEKYLNYSFKIWDFIKQHLIDYQHGEWHFRVDKNGNPYTQEDKVSMWKAPYHTSRACILLNI